uniref:Uncharacterized protein n=1 Tax=Arundo donax TaxID=35708 RepID=A0A0A9EZT2_ARUDO
MKLPTTTWKTKM